MGPDFEYLKRTFLSGDPEERIRAGEELGRLKNNETLDFLIPLLKHKDPWVRHSAAMVLSEIGDDRAAKPLAEAINTPELRQNRGTLVAALYDLDCSDFFLLMIKLALSNDYESQSHALSILADKKFKSTKGDIIAARKMVSDYSKGFRKCDGAKELLEEIEEHIERIEQESRED